MNLPENPQRAGVPRSHADEVEALLRLDDPEQLLGEARQLRDRHFGDRVTYSRKVFLPLTRLCRDVCHYCTFATTPRNLSQPYLSIAEQLAICNSGAELGCVEALYTLGERPELRYRAAREALAELGHASTIEYLRASAEAVLTHTPLLPHLNPGTMNRDEIRLLRPVAVSMGIMLESASPRLCAPGMPHHGSPDKDPALRLATLRLLGEEEVPVTTGLLIGIGETRRERLESLLALRDLQREFGHLQEVIVQNFRAKPGTRMAAAPEPGSAELAWTIAMARRIFGGTLSIQAPPNLSPGELGRLVEAGIDDWGGVSPLTPDHVNPEAPWPHLEQLARETAAAGKTLVQRLPLYPPYVAQRGRWLDPGLHRAVLEHLADCAAWWGGPRRVERADGSGLARDCAWRAGDAATPVPALPAMTATPGTAGVRALLARLTPDRQPTAADVAQLFEVRGGACRYLLDAADAARREQCGEAVTFVVNRNINYTNVCGYACSFCAFSKGGGRRGAAYDIGGDELARRTREAWERGATEVCLQGGIHPDYSGKTYLDILDTVRAAAPDIHIHAFSPLEVAHGAGTLGISVDEFIAELMRHGLGSMPGTAAEILCDDLRRTLCPDKLSARGWLEVMGAAHRQALPTTATVMFGHIDGPASWARHLLAIRAQQRDSGGFTEFVPLPFVAAEAPLYRRGLARPGPTFREAMLMHAAARLVLRGHIDNIQASWVKLGVEGVATALGAGANDLGGTLMNESITRAAGARHGQEWPLVSMQAFVRGLGRQPRQRTSLYAAVPMQRTRCALDAPPLLVPVDDPAGARARSKLR